MHLPSFTHERQINRMRVGRLDLGLVSILWLRNRVRDNSNTVVLKTLSLIAIWNSRCGIMKELFVDQPVSVSERIIVARHS